MKKGMIFRFAPLVFFASFLFAGINTHAQGAKDERIMADAKEAREDFIHADGMLKNIFDNAYGYVIFPNVGKGGIGIGGAAGNGTVFEKGSAVGSAKMTQLTVGLQWGGQAYREVIFFESKEALDRFEQGKFELAAQASAVAVTAGAAANVKYANGIMVFSQIKGGLMYEASVGGQKFNFSKF